MPLHIQIDQTQFGSRGLRSNMRLPKSTPLLKVELSTNLRNVSQCLEKISLVRSLNLTVGYVLCGHMSQFHVYLPCLNACFAQCLNRFLVVKALVGEIWPYQSSHCETSRRFVDSSKCEPGQLLISILSPLTVHYISIKFAADLEENGNKNMDHITIYVKT